MELRDSEIPMTSMTTNVHDVDATAYGVVRVIDVYKKLSIMSTIVTVTIIIIVGIITLLNKKISKNQKLSRLKILACIGIGVIVLCIIFIIWLYQ